ncbi:MAG: ATP-binding cassette domain-containing protein, partial [Thermodesulfovibrionales bacterium]|nr:ATP-binding cassette domain-containing protein [Thermodesulfovibrionales bacterium]
LGPNGAGKTTTIKILTTLTRPDSGRCIIDGYDVSHYPIQVKSIIGVVPQENNLDRELTAYENLKVYGMLYGIKDLENTIEKNLERVGLTKENQISVTKYSGGMQRRLLLARALMREPSVLFLDEPTIGLDPQIRRQIWDIIRLTKNEGRTVVLTTHYIEEADALCDNIAILSEGKLIANDTPVNLKKKIGSYVVEYIDESGKVVRTIINDRQEANLLSQIKSINLIIRESTLEDVFIELTGKRI